MSIDDIPIQICFLMNKSPKCLECIVCPGTTIEQALKDFWPVPGLEFASLLSQGYAISIYGKKRELGTILQAGDRIELCGPLIASPMEARRHRAKREHKGGKM